jgi:hypothetical protein
MFQMLLLAKGDLYASRLPGAVTGGVGVVVVGGVVTTGGAVVVVVVVA